MDRLCLKNSHGKRGLEINPELEAILPDVIKHANNEIGKYDLKKGLCFIGNCGSGKTNLLTAYSHFRKSHKENFPLSRCVDIANEFTKLDPDTKQVKGHLGIKNWTNKFDENDRGFDDLGSEEVLIKNFGNNVCVMANVMDSRHFCRHKARTFITTNLTLQDITNDYGERIESRIHELCNIIYLGVSAQSIDYRK